MVTKTTPSRQEVYYSSWTDDSRNSDVSFTNTHASVLMGNDFFSGSGVPLYKQKIRQCNNASSNFSRQRWLVSQRSRAKADSTHFQSSGQNYHIDSYGAYNWFPALPVGSTTDNALRDQALVRFKQKLSSMRSQAKVLAPLGESRELGHLIHQAVGFTGEWLAALAALRKGRTGLARKAFYDSWLGYNFGVSPMLKDINDARKAIAAHLGRQDLVARVEAHASSDQLFTALPRTKVQTYPNGCPLGSEVFQFVSAKKELRYRYSGGVNIPLLSSADYNSTLDSVGISLDRVPEALWELTAFSWVADYFTNVGQFLEDRFVVPSGSTYYLTLSRLCKITYDGYTSIERTAGNPSNVILTSSKPGTFHIEYVEYDRQVLADLPHIGLHFKTPDQIGKYGIPKLLNLISVLKR